MLAVVVALALAIWWWRDLPRRQIESALEEELRADVDVGGLSVEGSRRFTLHDLRVRRMGGQPYLEVAEVDRVTVEGSLPRLRIADFETMAVSGVRVLLRPPTGEPLPEPSTEPSTLQVGRLTLQDGIVVIRAGEGEARVPFSATVDGIGTDAVGEVRVQASSVPLGPVLALLGFPGSTGDIRDLRASVRLEQGAGAALDARASDTHVTATVVPAADGQTLALTARADLALARELHGKATLEAATLAPVSAEVHAREVAVGELTRLVPLLPAGASLDGTADVDVTLVDPHRVEVATKATLTRALYVQPALRIDLSGASAEATASLTRDEGPLRGPAHARLHLPRLEARGASGHLPARMAPALLDLSLEVASVTPPSLGGKLSLVTGKLGTLSAAGRVAETPLAGDLTWQWSGLTLAMLRDALADLGLALPEPLGLQGRALLQGTLRGPLGTPAIAGTLQADRLEAAFEGRTFRDGVLRARFSVPPGMASLEVPAVVLSGTAVVPPLAPLPLRLEGSARWDLGPARLTLPRATFQSGDGLGTLTLEGTWQRNASPAGTGRVRLEGAELPAWLPVLRPLLGDPVAGYTVRGTAAAEGAVRLDAAGAWNGQGKASIVKSGFASEDGSRVLEGFDSAWTLEGQGSGAQWRAHADADVGGFQLLWGTVFGDYSDVGSQLAVTAHGGAAGAPPWTMEATLSVPEGPTLAGSMQPQEPGGFLWAGSLKVQDLARTVARHLRAPLGDSLPLFERIEAKGRLEARASGMSSPGSHTAHGGLTLEGVDLAGTEGFVAVSGLDLVLPFDWRWTRTAEGAWSVAGPPAQGTVEFDRVEVAGLTLAALQSGVVCVGDDLSFQETLTVPTLGGEVRFEAARLQDLLAPTRHLRAGILVTGVTLAEVSRTFGLPPLQGSVEALFPEVRLDAKTLLVEGGSEVSVFGGKVRLAEISGEEVLTRFPKLRLSAEVEGIDLGRVTRTFDFGEVTGIVRGYVRDLRLFRGVPVSFEAAIQSVPTKGVKQSVNLKAVRNLTILGTGAHISPLDRGLQRFFDKYTYAELGIWMQLDNDVFLLRGTAGKRDGRELFVRGKLPFPINIVNAQPGKTVSFSSMVERLKSVDLSAAQSAP